MKCHILFPFVDGPWGGGNQFLKAQRQEMMSRGVYCDDADRADVVFTNSHHWLQQELALAMPALCDTIVNAPDSRFFFKAPRSPALLPLRARIAWLKKRGMVS